MRKLDNGYAILLFPILVDSELLGGIPPVPIYRGFIGAEYAYYFETQPTIIYAY